MKAVKTLIKDPWWTIDPVREFMYIDWEGVATRAEVRRRFTDQILIQFQYARTAEEIEELRDRCEKAKPVFCGRQLQDLEGLTIMLDNKAKEWRAIDGS